MLLDPARRLALRLDASYTEDLVRLYRAGGGHPSSTPVIAVPLSEATPSCRIAVIAHAFYPELLGQLGDAIRSLPRNADVFISVPTDSVRLQVLDAFEHLDLGLLDVRVVDNRGRDIAPKYVTFADVYGRGYDLLLFLHTKKSLTADFGDAWRDQLFRSVAGSPDVVSGIVSLFESNPQLGVVAPRHHEMIGSTTGWDGNYHAARRLSRRAGFPVHRWAPPDFASGSMFWARPQALADLTRLGLRIDEFPAENGQVGVTIMHALERMVFVAAAHAGFASVMVRDPDAPRAGAPEDASLRITPPPGTPRRPPARLFAAAAFLTAARSVSRVGSRLRAVVQHGVTGHARSLSHRPPNGPLEGL